MAKASRPGDQASRDGVGGGTTLPIPEDAIAVTRERRRIDVDGEYVRDVLLAPGYKQPWTFKVDIVVLTLN